MSDHSIVMIDLDQQEDAALKESVVAQNIAK